MNIPTSLPVNPQNFYKIDRLNQAFEYDLVFKKNQLRYSNQYLLILAHDAGHDHARIGLVVPKKKIRSAVHRNLFKRLVRENFRKKKTELKSLDFIVLAKRDIYHLKANERREIFSTMFDSFAS